MRKHLPLLSASILLAAAQAGAQNLRLQFAQRPSDNQAVSGALKLQIGADPIARPGFIRPGIELDGKIIAVADKLPFDYSLDTSKLDAGTHTIRLALVNTRNNESGEIEVFRIRIGGSPKPPPVIAPVEKPKAEPVRVEPPPTKPMPVAVTPVPAPRTRILRAAKSACEFEVQKLDTLPSGKAAAIAHSSSQFIASLETGDIVLFDPLTAGAMKVRVAHTSGPASKCLTDTERIWWVQELDGKPRLLSLDRESNQVSSWDVSAAGPIKSAGLYNHGVLISGENGSWQFNPRTGDLTPLEDLLPAEIRKEIAANPQRTITLADGSLCVASSAACWVLGKDGVHRFDSGRDSIKVLSGTENSLLLADGETLMLAAGDEDRKASLLPALEGERPGRPTRAAVSGSHVWMTRGNNLFHFDSVTGQMDAFLPWNDASARCLAIDANGATACVSTDRGFRFINLNGIGDTSPYGGYIRARLGSEQEKADAPAAQRLKDEILAWQGIPYKFGGESRKGIDCSGFVMKSFEAIGIRLPHGSDELRSMMSGAVVNDELRYGDVLVYPGHCAIYIGNGLTAETVSGQVGGRSIWFRESVVVRRFLGVVTPSSAVFASRGKGYEAKPAKKPVSKKSRKKTDDE